LRPVALLDLDGATAVGIFNDGWQFARAHAGLALIFLLILGAVVEEASPFYYRIQSPVLFHRIRSISKEIRSISKEDVMPVVDAVIVAVIVAAFAVFAGVPAWAEYQTRDLPPRSR
jgi:hypothetical protein